MRITSPPTWDFFEDGKKKMTELETFTRVIQVTF